MENIASFFGGIIALAALGLLLTFELSTESVLFVYVIYALIIIVAGTMVISIRGSIAALFRALTGRVSRIKPPPGEVPQDEGIEEGRKIERFFNRKTPSQEIKKPLQVKNPLLRKIAENMSPGKPQKKSRFSGLAKRLRGIRIPRPKMPKIRRPNLENIKKKLPKISRPKSLVKPEAAGKPRSEKPVEEIVSRSVQSRTRDISSSKAREEMKKPRPKEEKKPKEGRKPEKTKLGKTREIPPVKPKPITEEPGTSGSCQICGSSKGLKMHYIVPPEKGGTREKENTILLCGTHKKQAEQGMYSENLLRKLKGT